MLRRLNYTGRQRIDAQDVSIRLQGGQGDPSFDADVDLTGYRLPDDGLVVVEAYRQAVAYRFGLGTVAEKRPLCGCRLRGLGSGDGLLFRLKVVEPPARRGEGRPGRIIAMADRIRPQRQSEEKGKSLLPIEPGDFRDEAWRLEFDESGPPVLKVSRHLVPAWRLLPGSREFATLVLPEILRAILTRIRLIEGFSDAKDSEDWRGKWLRFASELPGVPDPPTENNEEEDEDWIDQVVSAFCLRTRMADRFRQWWKED